MSYNIYIYIQSSRKLEKKALLSYKGDELNLK